MTDASATAVRDARLAWIIGGSLFMTYGVLVLAATAFPGASFGYVLGIVLSLVWAAGYLVFAFGIRRHGSVVARQTGGVVAMVFAGLLPLVTIILWVVPSYRAAPSLIAILMNQTLEILSLAALVVAAVFVGRAGAVPYRVRWAPLIILAVTAGLQILLRVTVVSGATIGQESTASLVYASGLLTPVATLLLGILALFFAPREVPAEPLDRTVPVYGPPPAE